jgi:ribosomal protein L11 methylase PrmA
MRVCRKVVSPAGLLGLVSLVCCPCAAGAADRAKPFRAPDSVYVGTPHDVVVKMLQLGKVTRKDVVYDLGCGDGRIVVLAAKLYGCRGVGYDLDPQMVAASRAYARKHGVESLVTIEQEDIFTVDLRPATAILLYVLPSMNVKLIPQFSKMRPGSRIVAHDYGIDGIQADQVLEFTSEEDNARHTIFVYTTPLKNQ